MVQAAANGICNCYDLNAAAAAVNRDVQTALCKAANVRPSIVDSSCDLTLNLLF